MAEEFATYYQPRSYGAPATYALPQIYTTLVAQGIQPGGGTTWMQDTGIDPSADAKAACATSGGTWTTSGCVSKAASDSSIGAGGVSPARECPEGYGWDPREGVCAITDDGAYAIFAAQCQAANGVPIRPHHDIEDAYCQCGGGATLVDAMSWWTTGQVIVGRCESSYEKASDTPTGVEEYKKASDTPTGVEEPKSISPLVYVAGAAVLALLLWKR